MLEGRRGEEEERVEGGGQAGDATEEVEGEEATDLPHRHAQDCAGRRGKYV